MLRIANPFPLFLDARGDLLDAGYVYVGTAGADPETSPLTLYTDQALTNEIEQPLRTLGGLIHDGANPVFVYTEEDDYSIRVRDADEDLVYYVASISVSSGGGASYQPLDADLTAIAALATTAYGRSLLTLSNQAALQAAVGNAAALPLIGGAMTGNIIRQGAGVHVYHNDAAMTGGRIFVTEAGESDPTSQPGDIWLQTA